LRKKKSIKFIATSLGPSSSLTTECESGAHLLSEAVTFRSKGLTSNHPFKVAPRISSEMPPAWTINNAMDRTMVIANFADHLERPTLYWKARFFVGAGIIAVSPVLEILAIKLLIEILQASNTSASIGPRNLMLGGLLVVLYASSAITKAAVASDKARCAEIMSKQQFETAPDALISWNRSYCIEQHGLISTVLSGTGICIFAMVLNLLIGVTFAVFFSASLWMAVQASKAYRRYHNWAIRDKWNPGSTPYVRVIKRIVGANRTEALIKLSGMSLFAMIVWASSAGMPLHIAVVLAFAAKLLIRSASAIVAPLMRMERAHSQVELAANRMKLRRRNRRVEA
jgi:hypothetical protein